MPFENTFCDREECKHNVPDHPQDGHCIKCNCVGFFSKNDSYGDPLGDYYGKKIVDIRVAFTSDLDTAKHLINDFPEMASKFFQPKQVELDRFWKNLVKENPDLAERVSQKIKLFNQFGQGGMKKLEKDECEIVGKLCHDGANRDRSMEFMKEMVLSFLTTRFREFIRELLNLVFEIEFKYKGKHKPKNFSELESEAYYISEMDIKKMINEIEKKWGLKLNTQENFEIFTEFFYRRNIFTHNRGFPNKKYREKTGYNGQNKKLDLTNEYILKLIEIFYSYSDLFNDYFMEKECYRVNINKKGNSHHIDLTKGKGKIIPANS